MRRPILLLSLLLVVQLGLAWGLSHSQQRLAPYAGKKNLLTLAAKSVDRLTFANAEGTRLQLRKVDGNWTLPGHFNAPADGDKIDALLKKLTTLKRPWPVATDKNGDIDQRFKLAKDNFERRIRFQQGDKTLATLLLGSSPGFRKVHARLADEKTVYDIPFSTYQVSLKPEDWVDPHQLQLPAAQIKSIELPDCRLTQVDGKLQVEGLAAGEQTRSDRAGELLQALTQLRVLDVVGPAPPPRERPGALRLTLTLKDGSQRSLQLFSGEAKKGRPAPALLQASDVPFLFKVAPGLKTTLAGYLRDTLVETKPASAANPASSTAPAPSVPPLAPAQPAPKG